MGNISQNNSNKRKALIVNNIHLQNAQIITHSIHGPSLLVTKQTINHITIDRTITRLKQRQMRQTPTLIHITAVEIVNQQYLCTPSRTVRLYLEPYTCDLKQYIQSKSQGKVKLMMNEICEFVLGVTHSLIQLQKQDIQNCQLDKQSIVFYGHSPKVLDLDLANQQPYESLIEQSCQQRGLYLSPQVLDELEKSNNEYVSCSKADIFSLGMLTLQLACLQPLYSFYHFSKRSIDYDSLIERVSTIPYPTTLKKLIIRMIAFDANDRIGPISLIEMMDELRVSDEIAKEPIQSSRLMLEKMMSTSRKSQLTLRSNENCTKSIKPPPLSQSSSGRMHKHCRSFNQFCHFRDYENKENEQIVNRGKIKASYPVKNINSTNNVQNRSKVLSSTAKTSNSSVEMTFSPLYLPKIARVQEIMSIERKQPQGIINFSPQITKFNDSPDKPQSVSLRIKKSLNSLTKSKIQSSNKEQPNSLHKLTEKYKMIDFDDGCSYHGEIKDGKLQGNGILYLNNGSVKYSGCWQNSLYHGFGTLYNSDIQSEPVNKFEIRMKTCNWVKYQGQFSRGYQEGFGTIYFATGERFSGTVKRGQIDGYGCFYNNKNQMTSGNWISNRLQI